MVLKVANVEALAKSFENSKEVRRAVDVDEEMKVWVSEILIERRGIFAC